MKKQSEFKLHLRDVSHKGRRCIHTISQIMELAAKMELVPWQELFALDMDNEMEMRRFRETLEKLSDMIGRLYIAIPLLGMDHRYVHLTHGPCDEVTGKLPEEICEWYWQLRELSDKSGRILNMGLRPEVQANPALNAQINVMRGHVRNVMSTEWGMTLNFHGLWKMHNKRAWAQKNMPPDRLDLMPGRPVRMDIVKGRKQPKTESHAEAAS